MSNTEQTKGKVRLYCCGGAGTNIGSMLELHRNTKETGFAEVEITYIDTSRSNMKEEINSANCFILEGLDGSGKIRAENYEPISESIKAILHKFKPADLNIVISSGSGGSGSVIGPLITSELLANGAPVISMLVGSSDTRLDINNTLKTIKSYEAIAIKRNAPVVAYYAQNSGDTPRATVDKEIKSTIVSLCMLFSRQNRELDTKDLFNWLHFDRTTTYPVQLASLSITTDTDALDIGNLISVATLAKDGDNTTIADLPEYQCVGYLPEGINNNASASSPLHFITSDGLFSSIASGLNNVLKELERAQEARPKRAGILSGNDKETDTGMVL